MLKLSSSSQEGSRAPVVSGSSALVPAAAVKNVSWHDSLAHFPY